MIGTIARAATAALLVLCAGGAAFAQSWSGPDPERRPFALGHHVENLDFAVSEICFPYLIQNAEDGAWLSGRRSMLQRWRNPPELFSGYSTYRSGIAVTVGVREADGGRECVIEAREGDPEELRAALQARLDQMPAPMTMGGYQYPANTYARRDFLCGGAEGAHYTALISMGPRTDGARSPALVATMHKSSERNERCDGVAPAAAAAAPTPFPPDSLTARLGDALVLCRAALSGEDVDATAVARRLPLTAPTRALDTEMGALEDTGVAAFFGGDTLIRSFSDIRTDEPDFIMLILVIDDAGEKCQVSGVGRGNFGASIGMGLGGDWRREGEDLRGPNGERLRLDADSRADGLSVIHLYLTRS